MSLGVALRALRTRFGSAAMSSKPKKSAIERAAHAAVQMLESRLLFSTWFVEVNPYMTQGIAADTNAGTITLNNPVVDLSHVGFEMTVSTGTTWMQAVQNAVASLSVTSTTPGGTMTTYTNITGPQFKETYASMTGHTMPSNEQSISQNFGIPDDQKIIAFEDGTDSDFNDGYFEVYVKPVGTEDGECDCDHDGPTDDTGDDGNDDTSNNSDDPVNYFDGTVEMNQSDLSSAGFGVDWGVSRSWSNRLGNVSNGTLGNNMVGNIPQLVNWPLASPNGVVQLVLDNDNSIWFETSNSGATYTPDFFSQESIAASGSGASSIFTEVDTSGEVTTFHGFDASIPTAEQGQLSIFTDADGNTTNATYNGSGQLTEITRVAGSGGTAITESYLYAYLTSGTNTGKVSSVTLRRKVGAGSYSTVRSVAYTYYDGTTANGNAGDLELARVEDSSSNVLETDYYRYYAPISVTSLVANASTHVVTATTSTTGLSIGDEVTVAGASPSPFDGSFVVTGVTGTTFTYQGQGSASGTATGTITYVARAYQGGLKYYFDSDSYARLAAAVASPLSASDASIAAYATNYFEYNPNFQVSKEVAQGAGSDATGGLGTYAFAYSASANSIGYNSWDQKTIETLPDGNENIVYSNAYGEQMLHAFVDVNTGAQTIDFYEYDGSGRQILHANPSAVSGYDDTNADLLHSVSGNYQYLRDDSGLIDITDYASTTTATSSTAGNVAGYLQDHTIEDGELGTAILQDSQNYFSRSGSSSTFYPIASSTTYGGTGGTDPRVTSYAYTWYSGTVQMQSETMIQPPIVSAQNGPASSTSDTADADTTTDYFDTYGREIWSMDGGGFITYTEYDPATGAVTKQINDVNTVDTGDFTGLPAGWTTPAGGGLELITVYVVDNLGRTTEETDPDGNVTYTVYNDPGHEIRVYAGWHQVGSNWVTTGPIQVMRHYRPAAGASAGQQTVYDETLTSSATPTVSGGVPTGSETIDETNIQTLTRSLTNSGGQMVEEDDYFSLSGVSYSQASAQLGTSSNDSASGNYHATLYSFDNRGRQDRVEAPTGTITRTVYDGLGRQISTWLGTDDTPGSGDWSPTNNTSPSNMVDTEDDTYDQRQAAPSAPSLSQSGSGSTNAITYYVKVSYVGPSGESLASSESTNNVYSTNDLVVNSPASIAGATGYNVYASLLLTSPTFPGTVFTSAATTGGFLQASKTYRYEVTATTPNGETAGSAEESYAVPAGTNTNKITLNWNTVPGASGYKIYRTAANGATATEKLLAVITSGSTSSYVDSTNPVLGAAVPTSNTTGSGTETLQNGAAISLGTAWTQPTTAVLAYGMLIPVDQVGDSNLTQATEHPNTTSSDDRTTLNLYDWRDRLIASKVGALMSGGSPDPAGETDGVHRLITFNNLDNAGESLGDYTYAGDGVSLYDFANWSSSTDASSMRTDESTSYDDQGHDYQDTTYSVDPTTGTVGSSLVTNTFYDHRGNVVEVSAPGGQVTKDQYDGAGRDIKDSTTDGGVISGATQNWANAQTTTNDVVVEQMLTTYDSASNVLMSEDRQRFDTDPTTATGDLAGPGGGNLASRDYYTANYYDAANRMTDSIDVGTNGGVAYTRQSILPGENTRGKATATGTTTTLVDTTRTEASNYFIGYTLAIIGGTDAGQSRTVTAYNSSTGTLTVGTAFSVATTSSSVYTLVPGAVTGTASSGTTTTLVSSSLTQANNIFVGWTLSITAGTDAGKSATVTGFNSSTHTLTFSPAFSSAITSSSVYSLTLPALMTHTDYNAAGEVLDTVDPRGILSATYYDLMGRTIETIGAWDGTGTATPTSSTNQTTTYTYDGDSNELTQTAVMPSGGTNQTTGYIYTYNDPYSTVQSNDLLYFVELPDATTGLPSTVPSGEQGYDYNAMGEKIYYTDQNQTTHQYTYDTLGRMTLDAIPSWGMGANSSETWGHAFSFDTAGRVFLQTSYSDDTLSTVENQDEDLYNGYGQLIQEYQEYSGAVDTSTSASVQYNYQQPSGANYSRVTGMTYPNGRAIDYVYGSQIQVTSITRSGTTATVTVAQALPSGFAQGAQITMAGAMPSAYDGTFPVASVTGSTTFTYTTLTTPGSNATGNDMTVDLSPQVPVSTLTSVGHTSTSTVTVTTAVPNGLSTSDSVTISGASDPDFNGTYTITVSSSTVFTYTIPVGSITSSGDTGTDIIATTAPLASLDSTISRVTSIIDHGGSSAAIPLVGYNYLGLDQIVVENEPENNMQMTYVKQTGDTLAGTDAGDIYSGLDRFGRVADENWIATTTGTAVDRLQYGYDRDGNVLYENNLVNSAFSELYHANSAAIGDNNTGYDSLNRLTTFLQGTLSSSGNNGTSFDTVTTLNSTANVENQNSWTLDALGNWVSSSPNGTPEGNSFNSQNQETANGSNSLTYDDDGNMTTDEQGNHYFYDAWNKLVEVETPSYGGFLIQYNEWDAQGREAVQNNGSGNVNEYYTTAGQNIEEAFGTTVYSQEVWGLAYINDIVARDQNSDGNTGTGSLGIGSSGMEQRLYAQHDKQFTVVSLTSQTGTSVSERFAYDPYGTVTYLTSTWTVSGSGDTAPYWDYYFQGMRMVPDGLGNLYLTQTRLYDCTFGRWAAEDPAGYLDGTNLYQAFEGDPGDYADPTGLASIGTKIGWMLTGRYFQGSLSNSTTPTLGLGLLFRPNDKSTRVISDDEGEMQAQWHERELRYYRKTIYDRIDAGEIPVSSVWQTVAINDGDVRKVTGQWDFPSHGVFDTGWWIHGAEGITAVGSLQVRCFGGKTFIRNIDVEWRWYDWAHSNGEVSIPGVIEGIVGIALKLTSAQFHFYVPWKDDRSEVRELVRMTIPSF